MGKEGHECVGETERRLWMGKCYLPRGVSLVVVSFSSHDGNGVSFLIWQRFFLDSFSLSDYEVRGGFVGNSRRGLFGFNPHLNSPFVHYFVQL